MNLLLIFALFAGGGILFSHLLKKTFEQVFPVFLFSTVIVLYFTGFFTKLNAGVWLIVIGCICGLVLAIIRFFTPGGRKWLCQNIFTTGALAFVVIFAFIAVTSRGKVFHVWDEFSHWGPMLKETYRTNGFHNASGTLAFANKDYPPGMVLFEYLWCKLAGGVTEVSALRALQFFTLSLFLPVFSFVRARKQPITAICLLVLTLVMPCVFGMHLFYATIYLDNTLAVLLAYMVASAIWYPKADLFSLLNMGFACAITVLTKQMGLLGIGMVSGFFVVLCVLRLFPVFKKELLGAKKTFRDPALLLAVCMIGGLAAQLSWKFETRWLGLGGAVAVSLSGRSVSSLLAPLLGGGTALQQDVTHIYIPALFSRPMQYQTLPLAQWTYPLAVFLLLGIAVILCLRQKNTPHFRTNTALAASIPFFAVGYAVVMHILYTALVMDDASGTYSALTLASFDRYMSTMVIALACMLFMVYARQFTKAAAIAEKDAVCSTEKTRQYIAWVSVTLAITTLLVPASVYRAAVWPVAPDMYWYGGDSSRYTTQQPVAVQLQQIMLDSDDKVQPIYQGSSGAEYCALRFYMMPQSVVGSWSLGNPLYEGDIWTYSMTYEEWEKSLIHDGITHVYLGEVDDSFAEQFSPLFEDPGEIQNGSIFLVEQNGEHVSLQFLLSMATTG